ncbi:MAG TPA: DNA methyltransferase [Ktedonobacteraceae bacterium]|nr:DNA methyltransferase [Ktedonobacteraceae bacterium]
MVANKQKILQYLKAANFRELFVEELGWNYLYETLPPISCQERIYRLQPLVEKSDVKVYLCDPDSQGRIPDEKQLRLIDREVTKYAYEHIVIYVDAARENQVWQWVRRERGKPLAYRVNRLRKHQSGELLAQKLLGLEFEFSQDQPTTLDVARKVEQTFNVERVTKKFYERFQSEHTKFLAFIRGITSQGDCAWYTSLMLNRLMFIYFIQKQGFLDTKSEHQLDGDHDYLRHRLQRTQAEQGRDTFHSFYRYFLLRLFHDGLSKRERTPELEQLLGRVPYLNGGLFDVHVLEQTYPDIQIPDEAFERIFDFFDGYDWHLDDRPISKGNEINPDVLGYIFEKYINQKQMGAYYTKEDITEYISKNTIIPYLFDAAEQRCLIAFEAEGPVWSLLRDNPDDYIYEEAAHGASLPLPPEIEVGLHDVSQRDAWNRPAPADYALPTEIWREVVARRTRYEEIRGKLLAGEISSINDLITYNLDIRKFAADVITYSEGPDLLLAFYESIEQVSVLDPTCGSGAFLFAALNILQPLYEACLTRMQVMVEERDRLDAQTPPQRRPRPPRIESFRKILREVGKHHSREYFILKSIIIKNLYGVDIIEEATEICKLRLFLKLVVQVKKFEDIEPLPDIDFNIRAGNTLVGFANQEEVRKAVEHDLRSAMTSAETLGRIERKAQEVESGFHNFRKLQTDYEIKHWDIAESKRDLREKLHALRSELDEYLAIEYGIDRNNIAQKEVYDEKFAQWQRTHQPFHWFVEFYGIMRDGGFDVIIGNPPWKEYSAVKKTYTVCDYTTEKCGNLYGMCIERALKLRAPSGWMSYIVQLPLANSSRMNLVRTLLKEKSSSIFVITFDDRPGKLFEGLQHCRSAIFISQGYNRAASLAIATTRYQRWATEARSNIFFLLEYAQITGEPMFSGQFPKYTNNTEDSLFKKIQTKKAQLINPISASLKTETNFIFYQEATQYWIKATVGLPYYAKNGATGSPPHGRFLYFNSIEEAHIICALLNSNLFYTYFIAYGDCFHLSDTLVSKFPVTTGILQDRMLMDLNEQLMSHLKANAERKIIRTNDGHEISYDNFYGSKSKPIIDEIDRVLAKHYGFTEEELDFIINYDIKYRMGRDNGEEEEE